MLLLLVENDGESNPNLKPGEECVDLYYKALCFF